MLDDPAIFLRGAGQETGDVDQGQDWNVETVAEADEACGLLARIDIEAAGEHQRLVRDHAHRFAVEPDEAGEDVGRVLLLQFEEVAFVGEAQHHFAHVVGLVGAVGDDRVQRIVAALDRVVGRDTRRLGVGAERQEVEQPAHFEQRVDVVVEGCVGDRAHPGMRAGATELLMRYDLGSDGLHHVRAGDVHEAGIADHVDEIGHGRRIDRSAGGRAHDDGNLRYGAGSLDVAPEHFGIAAERGDALLDAGPAGIVEPDHRRAVLHGEVHDFADFLGVGLAERAAEYGEVLAEDVGHAAVDRAPASDDAVARDHGFIHPEIARPVGDEHVVFFKASRIEQDVETFTGGQLALAVLGVDPLLPAAEPRLRAPRLKRFDNLLHAPPARLPALRPD